MYAQNPPYPQQPGFNYGQSGYGYPPGQQSGYPSQQGGYPPSYGGGGSSISMPPPEDASGGGFVADPAGLFAEKAIRSAFVSKVYSILTIQLIFTSIMIGAFVLNAETKHYFQTSQGWLFVGLAIFMVSFLVLGCVESARRTTPCNMILLTIMTFGYGLVAAVTSCRYDTKIVLLAFVATGVSCFLIALFAKTTSFDMTNCGTTLCLLGLAHLVIGMILIVCFGTSEWAPLLISISGALLASLYLIFDLQLIMGGRKCEISPEEYILAAALLYVDIIQIFIYLLEIFSRLSDD